MDEITLIPSALVLPLKVTDIHTEGHLDFVPTASFLQAIYRDLFFLDTIPALNTSDFLDILHFGNLFWLSFDFLIHGMESPVLV